MTEVSALLAEKASHELRLGLHCFLSSATNCASGSPQTVLQEVHANE